MLFGTLRNRRSPPSTTSALRVTYYSRIHGLVSQLPGVDVRIWARVAEDKVAWARMIRAISIVPQTRGTAVDARHRLRVQDRPRTHGLTCPVPGCGYTSTNQQGLQRHINAKHGQAPQQSWTCASCERVFYHKGAFTLHVKSCGKSPEPRADQWRARTGGARPCVCSDRRCGLACANISQLNRHVQKQCLGRPNSGAVVRNDKYVFICCDRIFASTQALGIHKRLSHSGWFSIDWPSGLPCCMMSVRAPTSWKAFGFTARSPPGSLALLVPETSRSQLEQWRRMVSLTWWVLQCVLPTIRRLGLMALVLLAISVVRQRLQMVASWLLLLWNWHVWCWPMTVTFVNCKHPCPWCWSMTSRTLWLLHCWRLQNIGSSNTLVADHTPWVLAALLLALSCSSSCAHMVPLCTKTVTVFCWLPWRACCPTLSPSWFAKRFHCAVVDWTQRRVRRSLNFKSIRLLSLLRFSPWFELTLKNCRVSFWASARLELWCERLAINIFELQDFFAWQARLWTQWASLEGWLKAFLLPFFALCGLQISFRLHGGMISFLLKLDVYRYFLGFISEGATLAPQLLLYCTGFPFAIFLHGYCSTTALALFLRARHAHLWATTSSIINQSCLPSRMSVPEGK